MNTRGRRTDFAELEVDFGKKEPDLDLKKPGMLWTWPRGEGTDAGSHFGQGVLHTGRRDALRVQRTYNNKTTLIFGKDIRMSFFL